MKTTRAVTYSLLAHIRNSGALVQGPQDIFKPLIKRAISHLNKSGVTKGKNVAEIAAYADKLYSIDFPLPVIRGIVGSIANEVNTEQSKKFVLHDDGSFMMDNYLFDEFDEQMNNGKREIESLEAMFKEFCSISGHQVDEGKSILSFIDDNKQELSRYLAGTQRTALPDHTIEARFVAHFRDSPAIYGAIRSIYLGSILSNYVYYVPKPIDLGVELLFDTNFIVSLLDLNTVESTKSCNKLVEVCRRLGYKFSILKETIEETRNLLMRKAEHFETAYLPRLINPEDIYNACERRKLSKVDLERIADKVEDSLRAIGCTVVFPSTKERNEAKWSPEFTLLKSIRQNDLGALHDTLAIKYVRKQRGKVVRSFEEAKCWFVNNAITHSIHELRRLDTSQGNGAMPESIKADELLNILWLSSPAQDIGASVDEITDIGLNGLIAVTLSESMPKASIIRELDDNLVKYTGDGITDRDVVLVATRIANRQLDGIHDLNKAAKRSKEEFVSRVRAEAQKQEREEGKQKEKLNAWFSELSGKLTHFERARSGVEKKKEELKEKEHQLNEDMRILRAEKLIVDAELKRLQMEEEAREKSRVEIRGREFIQGRVKRRQRRSRGWLIAGIVAVGLLFLGLLWSHAWSMATMYAAFPDGMFTAMLWVLGIAIGLLVTIDVLWHHNHSNIKAYEERVMRSDEYKTHMDEGAKK